MTDTEKKSIFFDFPHSSRLLLAVSGGFVAGVALVLWNIFAWEYVLFVLGVGTFGIFALCYRYKFVWILTGVVIGCVLGMFCAESFLTQDRFELRQGEVITDSAVVRHVPRQTEKYLNVQASYKNGPDVLVRMQRHEEVVFGDVLRLTCTLEKPDAFEEFDYPRYLQMQGVHYICGKALWEKSARERNLLSVIATMRRFLEDVVSRMIKAPEAGLANGLLFGGDDRLSKDLQEDFSRTGMSHIVAVSGYNVSVIIIAVTAVMILVGLWRSQAAILAIVAVLLFVAMIGFPSSGVRAAIMGTIVLLAVVYGRAAHALGLIVFTGACMLLWNPMQLRYDVGFQLSFLAVMGIMMFYPVFERYVTTKHKSAGLTEIIFLTLSAQLFVMPILVYHFHSISLVSLLTNVLVLPIIPVTMLLVFIVSVVGGFVPLLAVPFAWFAQGFLSYELFVISFFAEQSWSNVLVEDQSVILMVLYYSALIAVGYYFYKKQYDE